jgi:hypothetical protein
MSKLPVWVFGAKWNGLYFSARPPHVQAPAGEEEINMSTYAQMDAYVRQHSGFSVKPCWIAHVLSDYGLTTRIAWNRIDPSRRKIPCPPHKRAAIVEAPVQVVIE